jgi:hypothetical protein
MAMMLPCGLMPRSSLQWLPPYLSAAQNAAIFTFLAGISCLDFKTAPTIVAVFLLALAGQIFIESAPI